MTARNLDALFAPRRIVLVGASERPESVGAVLAANLLDAGFQGTIDLVSPRAGTLRGRPVAPSIAALSQTPDLAIVATPAPTVPGLIAELGARGCRAAVVISAGFEGPDAELLRRATLEAARPNLLRIIGPNCLGVLSPALGLNGSFARGMPPPGGLALVSQSGAVAAAALDWAPAHGLGFSQVVTLGDSLDVDVGDLLDHLAGDPATKAILLYIESLRDAGKFLRAARTASAAKPVLVLKGGRSESGARAAYSHTGALAGADAVYSAAFRQAGLLQVDGLDELLDTALLVAGGDARGGGLALLTNGGGAAILAVDALERAGGKLAALSPATQARIRSRISANGACANPVDILGDAGPGLYAAALSTLLASDDADAVLAINCPTAVADSDAAAAAIVEACATAPDRRVMAAWLGEPSVAAGRARLAAARIPTYPTAEAAVRAFARLDVLAANRALASASSQAPGPADTAGARAIVARALDEGRTALDPLEVSRLLAAYAIPTPPLRFAADPAAAARAASDLGGEVALKICSRDLPHKSDVGGVVLDLAGAGATAAAAMAMLDRVQLARPDARIDGFLVQPMVRRPQARELLAGLVRDPTFGPVIAFGHGGVAVEVLADRALALAPLNETLARDLIARTRVSRLLAGYRDRPPADLTAVAGVLTALGRLAADLPEVTELDLNPLLADAAGVVAVDARIALRRKG